MKPVKVLAIVIGIVVLFTCSIAVGSPLNFKKLNGPTQIQLGPVYTYSVIVEGDYDEVGWSASGGKVLKDWWTGQEFFCEVQWHTHSTQKPAQLKVWGKDENETVKAARLQISLQSTARALKAFRSLRNQGGKCLDVHIHDLVKNGGKVQIWECNDQMQQKWRVDEKGRLLNGGGKCLDVHLPDLKKDGGKVQIWDCNDDVQQKWKLDPKGRFVNGGGKCLDVHVPDLKKDGGKVQIWGCTDDPQQKWTFK